MTAMPRVPLANRMSHIKTSSTLRVLQITERLKAQGIDVISLGAGEPDYNTPENIRHAAKRAIEAGFTKYTSTEGTSEFVQAIAARMKADFGAEYAYDQIAGTVGGKQAIFEAVAAIVDPGDDVLLPSPYWVSFPEIIKFAGGNPVAIDTEQTEFQLTAEMVERHITPRTKLLIVNTPNNPTGCVIPPDEIRRIVELAAERDFWVLTDDCYLYFVYPPVAPFSAAALPDELRMRCLVTGSFSKTYAMTGWRIGYALGPSEWIQAMLTIQGHSTSNPTSISQYAAIEAFSGPQDSVQDMLADYQNRRDWLVAALNDMPGVSCVKPEGAFYAFPNVKRVLNERIPTTKVLADKLLEESAVGVTAGAAFGAEGYIRLSYATALPDIQRAVDRMREFFIRYAE